MLMDSRSCRCPWSSNLLLLTWKHCQRDRGCGNSLLLQSGGREAARAPLGFWGPLCLPCCSSGQGPHQRCWGKEVLLSLLPDFRLSTSGFCGQKLRGARWSRCSGDTGGPRRETQGWSPEYQVHLRFWNFFSEFVFSGAGSVNILGT